jgi:O-methyltransferase
MVRTIRYAGHPHLPVRFGFRALLGVVNPALEELLRRTDRYTLVPARNRVTLYREAEQVLSREVPGAFVEVGVHRGGSAAILAHLIHDRPDRALHLFDRWGDLPDPTPEDGAQWTLYRRDAISEKLRALQETPPLQDVRRLLEDTLQFPASRLHYHQGWYSETLAPATTRYPGGPIAFASIDCDYYASVHEALDFVSRHAVEGTTVVVDDYGSWDGANRATHEFVDAMGDRVSFTSLAIGQAVLRFQGCGGADGQGSARVPEGGPFT